MPASPEVPVVRLVLFALLLLLGCSVDRPFTTWKKYVHVPGPPIDWSGCEGDAVCLGEHLFENTGCTACHGDYDEDSGPCFTALWGSRVRLASGRDVTVTDGYLRRAIQDPSAQVRMEWTHVNMPAYRFHDAQLDWLVAYLKSL